MAGNTLNVRVGPIYSADGPAFADSRQGSHGETIFAEAGGKYEEATKRGEVFSAITAATGVAPGTALGTTAAFCLYNPAGSGKRLIVQKIGMGQISGTMGAGTTWITSSSPGDAVPTGTPITIRSRDVGAPANPVAQAFATATVTTTAAKMIDIFATLTEEVVGTTTGPTEMTEKDIDGEIVIEPSNFICIHSTAGAGSTPLVVYKVSWKEKGIAA